MQNYRKCKKVSQNRIIRLSSTSCIKNAIKITHLVLLSFKFYDNFSLISGMRLLKWILWLSTATCLNAVHKLGDHSWSSSKHRTAKTSSYGRDSGSSSSHLSGSRESLPNKRYGSGSKRYQTNSLSYGGSNRKSLRGDLEALYGKAEFLIQDLGEILLAADNMVWESKMLNEMDDRLVYLYKFVADDLDELLKELRKVTDTSVMTRIKNEYNLDLDEEFELIGKLPAPDPNQKGDWSTQAHLSW